MMITVAHNPSPRCILWPPESRSHGAGGSGRPHRLPDAVLERADLGGGGAAWSGSHTNSMLGICRNNQS